MNKNDIETNSVLSSPTENNNNNNNNNSSELIELIIENEGFEANGDNNIKITSLLSSILNNQKQIVKNFIENEAGVTSKEFEILAAAVIAGNEDILNIILKSESHININDARFAPLLHLAILKDQKEMVKDLINKGISVDTMISSELHLKEGDQPGELIQLAVKKDNAEIIKDLIINGVNNGIASFGVTNLTPLCLAVYLGQEEIAEILIAHGANVNVVNIMGAPLHIAAANGYVNIVGNLLRIGADISIRDTDNSTPLELAVTNGHLQVVKIILKHKKVNMNSKCIDGWTILHYASQENNLAMVKFLVDEGCNINLETDGGLKPIHIAAREGNKDIVEFFVSKGLCINEPDKQNLTILHYAVTTGQLEVIKYLIEKGADVNAKNDKGVTPMHLAALCSCKKDVIEILLNNYAIYNAIDEHFMRPIDMASNNDVIHSLTLTKKLFESVKCNNISEVENNIRAGACVNAKNTDNITTLHYAAWKGYDTIVQILLQNKANPNAVGKNGYTPIHYAAKFSHLQVVNALLSYGAAYNALSDSGKTPLDLSEGTEVTSLLKIIDESFKTVIESDVGIVDVLTKLEDIDMIQIVMYACNRENESLMYVAFKKDLREKMLTLINNFNDLDLCGTP